MRPIASRRGKVAKTATDIEVIGVVERGLGAEGAGELEVLLDLGSLVVEAKAGLDAFCEHASAKRAWRLGRAAHAEAATEEKLYAVWPADVEVVANDLLEELAPMNGPVERPGSC